MENNIQIFENLELGKVRVIIQDGEPLFCLSDIAKVLEYTDRISLKRSVEREFDKGGVFKTHPLETKGGIQNFSFINESELYFCIMRSNSNKAKPFRQWVCNEVLPSIRKYGNYCVGYQIPQTYAEALLEAGRLALENEKLIAQAKDNEPKVKCFNELMDSKNAVDFLTFSKILGIGRTKLFQKCRELDILMDNNMPYQNYIDKGYFRVIESTYSQNDVVKSYTKTMILPKGQSYLAKRLKI